VCYPYQSSPSAQIMMPPPPKRAEITLETQIESVDLAEDIALRVAAAAGFSEDECHRIGMSVREAVINAHNYGNHGEKEKKIRLIIELDAEKLTLRVQDQGSGFDPTSVPDPCQEENLLRTSGRGLFLMKAFMDEMEIQRTPQGGTDLVMSKRLPRTGQPAKSPYDHN
jgi:serine/threonine-protein kinase RsbW